MSQTPWFDYAPAGTANGLRHNPDRQKAIVIGGGIAGCQLSWHLNRVGWQVDLIERRPALANAASGNPAGVISPKLTVKPGIGESFYLAAFEYTVSQLDSLQVSGLSCGWHPCGVLQLAHNPREKERLEALRQREFNPEHVQFVDAASARQIAGIVVSQPASWFPRGGFVKPAQWCSVLTQHPLCRIHTHQAVISLEPTDNGWQVLDSSRQGIAEAPVVIIANGHELGRLQQTGELAGMTVRGQTSLVEPTEQTDRLRCVLCHEGYLTPAINLTEKEDSFGTTDRKQHVFGATFERHSTRDSACENDNQSNLSQLRRFIDAFQDENFDSTLQTGHAAIRFSTPDRLPYAGAVPDVAFYRQQYADLHHGKHWKNYPPAHYLPGLYVLAGFGSRGLTTAPFSAALLSELITSQTGSLTNTTRKWLTRLHPARFLIKSLKRGNSSPGSAHHSSHNNR